MDHSIGTIEVRARRIILPPRAVSLWRRYDATMRPINRLTPCRQSFHGAGFLRLMADPRVIKLIVARSDVFGLAAVTRRIELLPWVSIAYFAELERSTGRPLAYVPILAATSTGAAIVAPALLRSIHAACVERWGIRDLGFDVCPENAALPALIARVLGPRVRIEPLGAQKYFHITDADGGRQLQAAS